MIIVRMTYFKYLYKNWSCWSQYDLKMSINYGFNEIKEL